MIILFPKNVNEFCKKSFENCEDYDSQKKYIQELFFNITNHHSFTCPKCHMKYSMIKYGFYSRHVGVLCKGKIVDFYIKVQRFQCKGCKSTDA